MEMVQPISTILKRKGGDVWSVSPDVRGDRDDGLAKVDPGVIGHGEDFAGRSQIVMRRPPRSIASRPEKGK
jgi:hypothetical protein